MNTSAAHAVSCEMVEMLRKGESGGTLDPNGMVKDVSGHFVVGGVVPSLVITLPYGITDWNDHIVVQCIADFVKANHVPGTDLGFWLDNGKLHVDVVNLLTDRGEAVELGQERGELAIFDGTTFEDIRL